MAFLGPDRLGSLGFRKLGRNVLVSDKAVFYNCGEMELGDNARIDDFCVLSGRVSIGRNVHIAVFCNVAGGSEGVFLEDFSGLAYGCHVFSQSDDYSGLSMTNPTVPAKYKMETKKRVRIGRHCIVGAGSIVLPGVDLADGCSVGAMSLVTKSTKPWGIYFGIPAKRLKDRKTDLLELERQFLGQTEVARMALDDGNES